MVDAKRDRAAYVELDAALINEGKFIKEMDRRLRQAFRELKAFEAEAGTAGKATVSARITIARAKDMQEHYTIKTLVTIKTPVTETGSMVKEKNGRLLCRPEGSAADTPDQRLLFDASGLAIAGVDPDTGEVYGHGGSSGVAGRVGVSGEAV